MCNQSLHLTLPEELFRKFSSLAESHGYKNVQAVIISVLRRFSSRAERQEKQQTPIRLSIEDEIDDMFNELARIHIMPEDTAPPKVRRPQKTKIEQGNEKGSEKK